MPTWERDGETVASSAESLPFGVAGGEAFRSIAEQLLDVIFVTDREGVITYMSPSANRVFGSNPQEMTGRSFTEFLPEEECPKAVSAFLAAVASGQATHNLMLTMKRKDGGTFPGELNASTFQKDGVIGGTVGLIRDVTERKWAEERMRQSEEGYRTLFDTLLEGFCVIEVIFDADVPVDYRFLEINPAFERQTGLKDARGRLMRELAPHHEAHWFEIYGQVALTGQPARFMNQAKALNRWYDVSAYRIGGPESRKVAILFNDISEAKRAEEALRESRAKLDAALASMTDAVFISDAQGRFIDFNDAFATFHRFRNKGECAKTFADYPGFLDVFLPDGTPVPLEMWAVSRALRGDIATNAEYTLGRKDTGETWVGSYSFGPIRDEEGSIVGSVVVGRDVTEHKRAETALQESEERWKYALEGAGDGVWDWNAQTNEVHFSRQWKAMLGYGEAEIADRLDEWDNRVHPDDREATHAAIEAHLRNDTPTYRSEHRLRCKDGNYKWILARGKVLNRSPDGKALRVIGTHSDITERKQGDEALRQSERRLAFALDTTAMGAWDLDLVDHVAHRSLLHDRIFGYQSLLPQWTFEMFLEHVLAEDREAVNRKFIHAVQTKTDWDFECRIRRTDGQVRWIWAAGRHQLDSNGEIRRMAGVVQDITERRLADAALRESEEQRRAILQTAMDGFWLADTQGGLLEVNETYCRMSGYTAQELLTMRVNDLEAVEAPDDTVARTQRIIEQGENRFESRHRRKNGSVFDTEVSAQYRPTDGGRIVAFLRDITDQKQAEQEKAKLQAQFHQAQKMESVGRLAGGVAHDFNNLLTVINGYSKMLLAGLKAGDPLRETVEEIHLAGERAAGLTRQLLAFSRKQVLEPRRLDVNRVVEEMQPMLERLVGDDVEVRVALDAKGGIIHADPHQLEQVVMNLVVNARDAMPGVGKLMIETANVERNESYARSHTEARVGRYVLLAVSDTGVGMDEATKSRIFEPFFTTKAVGKGTGLGLSMVQGIVAQSGGHVEVYSEPGRGTTFKIYLPAAVEGAADAERPVAVLAPGGKETVLVVEDQAKVRKYVVEVLKSYGYRAIPAENGDEALLLCGQERIDLVLTDVVMPKMSGRELAHELEALQPGIKILFMSGYTDSVIEHHGVLEEGANFIQKPFSPEDLAGKVRGVLDPPAWAQPARILVVDDEAGVRGFLRKVLEDDGYEVIEAGDGKQALRQARAAHVDLVITDLVMPELEGIETIRALRREVPGVRIIAISGAFGGQYLTMAQKLGAAAVLNKPVNAELLLARVAELLNSRR